MPDVNGLPFTSIRLPGLRSPRRGDVIVFDWPPDPSKQFIKRCIGLPGDRLEVRHKDVYRNGHRLVEPYVRHKAAGEDPAGYSPRDNYQPPTVPAGALFMMGDNRDNSADSRAWGPLDKKLIAGKAMFIYFSWNARSHSVRFSRVGDLIR